MRSGSFCLPPNNGRSGYAPDSSHWLSTGKGENGEVVLVEATPDGFREKGRFAPPNQPKRSQEMEMAWAYPVVSNGWLYIRDHGMLWCYDVKAGG